MSFKVYLNYKQFKITLNKIKQIQNDNSFILNYLINILFASTVILQQILKYMYICIEFSTEMYMLYICVFRKDEFYK